MKTKKVYKSAVSGRFVEKNYAGKIGKKTTFTQKVIIRGRGRR